MSRTISKVILFNILLKFKKNNCKTANISNTKKKCGKLVHPILLQFM